MQYFFANSATSPAIPIVAIVFSFLYLTVRATTSERERKRRLDLLEVVVRSGQIDEATKRELLTALGSKSGPRIPFFMGLGWVGLAVGIALLILAEALNERDLFPAGVIVTAVSFAVLSMPIAARELQGRRAEPSPRT